MPDLLLIRHGVTDGNESGIIMGRSGHPLNTDGRAQVRRLAKFIKDLNLDAIYVSPSKRGLQTAQLIMKGRDAIPLVEEAGLDEIDFGQWVGKSIHDIKGSEEFHVYMYRPSSFTPPGGESIGNVQGRAVAAVNKVLEQYREGRIALISHADVIKTILVHYLDMPLDNWQRFKVDNGSVSILRFIEGKKPRAVAINLHSDPERYTG